LTDLAQQTGSGGEAYRFWLSYLIHRDGLDDREFTPATQLDEPALVGGS